MKVLEYFWRKVYLYIILFILVVVVLGIFFFFKWVNMWSELKFLFRRGYKVVYKLGEKFM